MAEGDAYAAQGKLKEATIEYRNALKAVPDLVEAHYKLGRVYLQTDDPEKAYQSFVRAATSIHRTPMRTSKPARCCSSRATIARRGPLPSAR